MLSSVSGCLGVGLMISSGTSLVAGPQQRTSLQSRPVTRLDPDPAAIPPDGGSCDLVASAEFAAEALAHQDAGVVEADDFHVLAVAAVLLRDGVQRCDGGGVPEVGGVHVDHDVLRVQRVFEL